MIWVQLKWHSKTTHVLSHKYFRKSNCFLVWEGIYKPLATLWSNQRLEAGKCSQIQIQVGGLKYPWPLFQKVDRHYTWTWELLVSLVGLSMRSINHNCCTKFWYLFGSEANRIVASPGWESSLCPYDRTLVWHVTKELLVSGGILATAIATQLCLQLGSPRVDTAHHLGGANFSIEPSIT